MFVNNSISGFEEVYLDAFHKIAKIL